MSNHIQEFFVAELMTLHFEFFELTGSITAERMPGFPSLRNYSFDASPIVGDVFLMFWLHREYFSLEGGFREKWRDEEVCKS